MRRHPRLDNNHTEIVAALRAAGVSVWSTAALGEGFPDAIASTVDGGNVLLEIKQPGEKLTPAECHFFANWKGEKRVVFSVDDALEAVGR